jgi:hypothetical protein
MYYFHSKIGLNQRDILIHSVPKICQGFENEALVWLRKLGSQFKQRREVLKSKYRM